MRPGRCRTAAASRAWSGLRTLLLSHREDFVRTFTEKLLAYAIGRGIEYYDLPAVRTITTDAAADDHRWSADHHRHRPQHAVQHEHAARRREPRSAPAASRATRASDQAH